MLDVRRAPDGAVILSGRLDAASVPAAREFFAAVTDSTRVDCSGLDYVASAGLGLLAAVQRRLCERGKGLTLSGLNPHVREILDLAGFESFFTLE